MRKSNEIGFVAFVLAMLALPFIANELDGTVAPSVEQLLSGSNLVVLATVSEVENPGAAKRTITLNVKRVLWPNFRLGLIDSITLSYERFGKGDINFERIKSSGNEKVFCLRYVPDDWGHLRSVHIEMTDAWFGSLRADFSTLASIRDWVASK